MKKQTNKVLNKKDFSITSAPSIFRLINFTIDTTIWLTLYFLVAYFFDLYFVRFSSYVVNYIYSISLALILYLTYYSLLEFYFHRTLGKFLTRTQVVNLDGGDINFLTIFKRTTSRLIPIDIFFYFFSRKGLHDRLSNTIVIKTNANKELS